jgi:hypothetical protein
MRVPIMTQYKLKSRYKESKRLSTLFKIASYLVFSTFFMVSGTLFLPADMSFTFEGGPLHTLLFWLFFSLVFMLICANFFLWVGMLHFLSKYDGRPAKLLWGFVVFFGLSYGAGLYYFFVFRKLMAQLAIAPSQPDMDNPSLTKT